MASLSGTDGKQMVEIALLSLGPFAMAAAATILLVFQLWLFVKKPGYRWLGWGAGISLAAAVYGLATFFQFNSAAGTENRIPELFQYSTILFLVQALCSYQVLLLHFPPRLYLF